MRVLVTGGAGFIGSHVVDALIEAGHSVRVLDALLPLAHRVRPDYLHPDADYVWAEVGDRPAMNAALDGIDAVSHQAAMVGFGTDLSDAPAFVHHNDLATAELLAALAARRFAGPLVLASSMVVYGEGRYRCPVHGDVAPGPRAVLALQAGHFDPPCPRCGTALEPAPIPETARLDPRTLYAATKLHQEHLAACFARETGATVTALRYHNVYGPRMPRDTPYAGVAAIFASALAGGAAPRVFEDGAQRRDFIHVRDIARANLLALSAGVPGAFNVASGTPRTIGDMAGALADAYGDMAPRPVVTGEFRLGDVRHVFASPECAARELGFAAQEEFSTGVAEFARAPLRAA